MSEATKFGILIAWMVGFVIGYIACGIDKRPTAMEVYQGKTTLEITYRNGVPIDSTVVYKGK